MGAIRLIYDQTTRQLKRVGRAGELSLQGTRRMSEGPLRYCLQGNMLYLPADQSIVTAKHRLCWGRYRVDELDEHPWLEHFDTPLDVDPLAFHMPFTGIGFGVAYSKRHRETPSGRIPVNAFVSQSLMDKLAEHPEALNDLAKADFEALVAELFARMGCDVDLYRPSKDSGIDFLAVKADGNDPLILCVQCKHPDKPAPGKRRRSLPVATVREIYGVAKAHNLFGCIAVTSSTYTPEAKAFAERKPEEIALANVEDIHNWIRLYRWNADEVGDA